MYFFWINYKCFFVLSECYCWQCKDVWPLKVLSERALYNITIRILMMYTICVGRKDLLYKCISKCFSMWYCFEWWNNSCCFINYSCFYVEIFKIYNMPIFRLPLSIIPDDIRKVDIAMDPISVSGTLFFHSVGNSIICFRESFPVKTEMDFRDRGEK